MFFCCFAYFYFSDFVCKAEDPECVWGNHTSCHECCTEVSDRYAVSVVSQQTNANIFHGNPLMLGGTLFLKNQTGIDLTTPLGIIIDTDVIGNENPTMAQYHYGDNRNAFLCGYPFDADSDHRVCDPDHEGFDATKCVQGCGSEIQYNTTTWDPLFEKSYENPDWYKAKTHKYLQNCTSYNIFYTLLCLHGM